jgi:ribosomal protein S18 acetylase RimI-like enzyme
VRIKSLSRQDISQAVSIHARGIGYSINALLGNSHLGELYAAILESDQAEGFVAVDEECRVVGVVTGVFDLGAFRQSVTGTGMITRSAARFALRPKVWPVLFESLVERCPIKPKSVAATLTSIAVDERARGRGVGRMLVDSLERSFASRGIREYWLETRRDNTGAQDFYTKIGFQEYSRGSRDLCLVKKISDL